MFDGLSQKLTQVFDGLRKRGHLNEDDVKKAMREIRIALLEADVALPVVRQFINSVTEKAIGQDVVKSITPGQMVVKIVHDELIHVLGDSSSELKLSQVPSIMLMVGLQGSGKTTFTGKLGRYLRQKTNKKILVESLDVYRPAARDQLKILCKQVGVDYIGFESNDPLKLTENAVQKCRREGYDVLLLDTAGRLQVDEKLMEEIQAIHRLASPSETLFVADSMLGQEAYQVATAFHKKVPLSGVVLTRIDGDARGGAALSVRHVTGTPIKFLGTGEKAEDLEAFDPARVADRILGMGDVVGLVEKAAEAFDQKEAEALAKKMQKGQFSLADYEKQLQTMNKMGGLQGIMGMMPGIGKIKNQLDKANIDEKVIHHQVALIRSMTPKERQDHKMLNASRKRRIAQGAGLTVQDINRLLKQFQDIQSVMKRIKKMGMGSLLKSGLKGLFK